jgi:hypothetical protein
MGFISFAQVGASYTQRTRALGVAVQQATAFAAVATARTIRERGRQNIAAAGQFGARWQEGLNVDVNTSSSPIVIEISHDQPGFRNFEFGGEVFGKPLLWIPLSFADPKAKAANFPGGLFRVDRKGKPPLLLSIKDRKPKFVGKTRVKVPQKFHVRDIAADAMARDFPNSFNRFMSVANA